MLNKWVTQLFVIIVFIDTIYAKPQFQTDPTQAWNNFVPAQPQGTVMAPQPQSQPQVQTINVPDNKNHFHCDDTCRKEMLFPSVSQPITSLWPLKKEFGSVEALKLHEKEAKFGLVFNGQYTRNKIKDMMAKAMAGKNVSILILGGSSTNGADLGLDNRRSVYHYAIEGWWKEAMGRVTGSFFIRHVAAVGGIGTRYVGHCWQEYLSPEEDIDLVIWEFSINDPDSLQHEEAIERFIRSVLMYKSSPAILFAQFFKRGSFPSYVHNGNFEACFQNDKYLKALNNLAQYYQMSVINLLKEVCQYMLTHNNSLTVDEMFIDNHPAHMAHAQMAYIIISYLKNIATDYFAVPPSQQIMIKSTVPSASTLPTPVYSHSDYFLTICWTAVVPNYRFPARHSLFDLHVLQRSGFEKLRKTDWVPGEGVRADVRGGWKAVRPGSVIEISIPVDQTDSRPARELHIAISRLMPACSETKFTLANGDTQTSQVYKECPVEMFKAQTVFYFGPINYGQNRLKVETITGPLFLNALIVE